jgi:hypothetical protein
MIYIFGTRCYGKCDKVPNLFYVATQFFHINFVPLFPVRSYLILAGSESGGQFRGMQIGMSARSVLYGYLRAGSIVGMIVGLIWLFVAGATSVKRGSPETMAALGIPAIVLIASVFVLVLTYALSHASIRRARDLADQIGMPSHMIDQALNGESFDERTRPSADVTNKLPADYDERFYDDRGRHGVR